MPDTPTTITTSGGLLTAAFVEALREPGARQRGLAPEDFALPGGAAPNTPADLEAAIAAAWELLLERWDAVRADLPLLDVSQVRARWLLPLFKALDFDPVYLRSDTLVDENEALRFPLTHRGWEPGGPVLHMLPVSQDLDARAASGRGYKAKSPHDMLQVFLNVSRADTWAVLTNGMFLRLLRTYHHTFTKGYVQFDLEALFETRNYGDFRALYRMCHASRFEVRSRRFSAVSHGDESPTTNETSEDYPLEWFYQDALATGIKVGEDLRGQVRTAIEALGNGFLDGDLIQLLTGERITNHELRMTGNASRITHDYYAEILHIVYRILFLLFAEQRGLLPNAGAPLAGLYREQYSITALRGRAEGDLPQADPFSDLWEGLKVTFRMIGKGAPELGVFGYDGMLFADGQTPLLGERALDNSALLRAIRALTLIERAGVLQRISYADLGVEELGAIYESLLDYTPRVTLAPETVEGTSTSLSASRDVPAHTFILDPRGMARKTSGSYYTHPSLVNELIESALLPVMQAKVRSGRFSALTHGDKSPTTNDYAALTPEQRAAAEAALLSIKICDPAVGSGHFLVKANNVLGAELARVRTGDDYPTEAAVQAAKRDVLAHCIYAVDLNPMAVELCKVSLWINASVRDAPLNFLDHHIRCGNSLVGATPLLIEEGVPYEAFALGRAGDDGAVAKQVRTQHRDERRTFEKSGATQPGLFQVTAVLETPDELRRWVELESLADVNPTLARERFAAYQADEATARARLIADTWTAAFFWPLTPDAPPAPTFNTFREVQARGKAALTAAQQRMVAALAEKHRFFHWHLAFPDVFDEVRSRRFSAVTHGDKSPTTNGFDVILGNPPWERIKLQEKEFFGDRAEPAAQAIAGARTAAERGKLIAALPQRDPALHAAYGDALHSSEALSGFLRDSGRYPLSAQGDINTYQVFAGLARQLVGATGRAGVVLPTGIATDFYNKDFFAALVANRELVSLYDFENRQGLFPGVHRSFKFSLVTLAGAGAGPEEAEFAFFLYQTADLDDPERHFVLNAADLMRINPNTQTCPIFRTRRDADLTRKFYRAAPVLVNETTGENLWKVSYSQGLFHSSNDVGFFLDEAAPDRLPLYDGRMIGLFDHRASSVGISDKATLRTSISVDINLTEHQNPSFSATPRYWIATSEVQNRFPVGYTRRWSLTFKDVTASTNERTAVFAIVPWAGVSDRLGMLWFAKTIAVMSVSCLIANLNAMVFDFVVRQKVGGIHLKKYALEQLPVLPPDRYTPDLLAFIVPRVLELTYTAWDLRPFADDVWAEADDTLRADLLAQWEANEARSRRFSAVTHGDKSPTTSEEPTTNGFPRPPFTWDEERRAALRADLDALYAHLYGLTREELDYILDTFPIIKRKDEGQYGEYRTKRLVLEAFDKLEGDIP
ncbi:MAG TPA: hypothetical protein PKH77_06430 [Anaerolineae bacterium]|nr:hypothetical protein [Anaerolineae bacterium]